MWVPFVAITQKAKESNYFSSAANEEHFFRSGGTQKPASVQTDGLSQKTDFSLCYSYAKLVMTGIVRYFELPPPVTGLPTSRLECQFLINVACFCIIS